MIETHKKTNSMRLRNFRKITDLTGRKSIY